MALTQFLLGKHLTACTIAGISVDSSGNGTLGTVYDLMAWIAELPAEDNVDLEDVRPLWKVQQNMVETGEGQTLRLAVLQRSDDANVLTVINVNFEYFQVAWSQGDETYTGAYKSGGLSYGISQRGQNIQVLNGVPCDFNDGAQVVVT